MNYFDLKEKFSNIVYYIPQFILQCNDSFKTFYFLATNNDEKFLLCLALAVLSFETVIIFSVLMKFFKYYQAMYTL